jgi:hypothetical protein
VRWSCASTKRDSRAGLAEAKEGEMATAPAAYPVTLEVDYPERLSRGLIFVKWLLALPHWIILGVFGYLVELTTFISWFAILFTTRYPKPLFDLAVMYFRWSARTTAYIALLRDEYPPFGGGSPEYPVRLDIDYPEKLSRLLIFVKWLLAIPHLVILALLSIVAFFVYVIGWFAILFTGRLPRGLFDFLVGVGRWSVRVNAYVFLMRDEYPPFSMS